MGPEVTITAKISGTASVEGTFRDSRVRVAVDGSRHTGEGTLTVGRGNLHVSLSSVLTKTRLLNKDMISQLAEHSSITGGASSKVALGHATVDVGGHKISAPVEAAVDVSVTPPNKVQAEIEISVQVPQKGGAFATIQATVSVDATIDIHPVPWSLPRLGPSPKQVWDTVEKILESAAKEIPVIVRSPAPAPGIHRQ